MVRTYLQQNFEKVWGKYLFSLMQNDPKEDEWLVDNKTDQGNWTLDQLIEPVPVCPDDDTG